MRHILHSLDGLGLFFDADESGQLLVEGADLGRFLGYTQPGSVRKQLLDDWDRSFLPGKDFLERSLEESSSWAQRRAEADDGTLREVVRARAGRVFLTEVGLAKFLARTSKPSKFLRQALAALSPVFRDPCDEAPSDPGSDPGELEGARGSDLPGLSSTSITPISDPAKVPSDPVQELESSWAGLEQLSFRHQVRQTLIENLHRHRQDPLLLRLALTAAEEALGCRLGLEGSLGLEERAAEPSAAPAAPAAPAESPRAMTDTQLEALRAASWTTMSAIGRRTGHSAVDVGRAANRVAATRGVSPTELRARDTRFSRVRPHPDRSTGKPRPRVEFLESFAELIVEELRKTGVPRKTRAPLTEFGAGGQGLPKLSQPLELSDDETPEVSRPKLSQPLDLGDAH